MLLAILKEIELAPPCLEEIQTIYLGGGTPSLCEPLEMEWILAKIFAKYSVSSNAEITIEANPDDVTTQAVLEWVGLGINRLSIGVQSFFEEDLKWMNRAHNAAQSLNCLQVISSHFANYSMDLIYGTPFTSNEKWQKNMATAVQYKVPHLSCYALTVEPNTPLQKKIQKKQTADVDAEKQAEQFIMAMDYLAAKSYEHYEISSFALNGFLSRHNTSYWQAKTYFGFGPAAHSYDGTNRWWNVANNLQYIKAINAGILPKTIEALTTVQKRNEYIMLALRTREGVALNQFSKIESEKVLHLAQKYILNKKIVLQNNNLTLTQQGKLFADGIAADLFF